MIAYDIHQTRGEDAKLLCKYGQTVPADNLGMVCSQQTYISVKIFHKNTRYFVVSRHPCDF